MRFFPRRVEHALDVSVQCPHHADVSVHQRSAIFRRHDQRFGRNLPFNEYRDCCSRLILGGVSRRDRLRKLQCELGPSQSRPERSSGH
jgi:hypothetical protein